MAIIGASVLYTCEDQILLLRDKENFWEIPGGKVNKGENADDTQKREITEEIGSIWEGSPLWTVGVKDGDDVVKVSAISIKKELTPLLSEEHTAWGWFPLDKIPRDTRPISLAAIDRLNMRFDQIAKAIADGIFASPVWFENSCLFSMRISGTNFAIREGPDDKPSEITFRNPKLWTSESMLEASNGLPVVLMHPKALTLTDDDFSNTVVGTIILPFVRDDELWGIARIINRPVAEELISNKWSTSPGVIAGKNSPRSIRPDGGLFIYEDKPLLLDHLAICEQGVWDKSGPPRGIDTDFNGEDNMDKETLMKAADCLLSDLKSRRDSVKKDGDIDDGLEKAISKLSGAKGLLEGMGDAKMDAADPDLKQIASDISDIGKEYQKNDADVSPAPVEPEDDACKDSDEKKDSDLEEHIKSIASKAGLKEEASTPAMMVAPKADACRKDDDTESSELKMIKRMKAAGASPADIMACLEAMYMMPEKDDEESEEKNDKKASRKDVDKKEREEEERKDLDSMKADSAKLRAENAELQRRLNEVDRRTRPLSDDETNEISAITARADAAYNIVGSNAPKYVNGELPIAFRRRLAKGLLAFSKSQKGADLSSLSDTNFDIAERQIYADAMNYQPSMEDIKPNMPLRRHMTITPGGHKVYTYTGSPLSAFARFISNSLVG